MNFFFTPGQKKAFCDSKSKGNNNKLIKSAIKKPCMAKHFTQNQKTTDKLGKTSANISPTKGY